jgi:hypothetical protein
MSPKTNSGRRNRHDTAALALGVFLLLSSVCLAGLPSFGTVHNFKHPEYYDPPHQTQLKSLLRGAVAEPETLGRVRIKDLRLDTFRETGEAEMIVEAPECIYDPETRQASSAGRIQAHSADNRFFIEGSGFLLIVTNKSITISNNVRTTIRDLGSQSVFPGKP